MTQTELWTIGRLLTWTTDYLRQRSGDDARLEAEVLLAEARGCQRIDLYAAYNEPASEPVRTAFRELVRRRAEGEPVAYLVGRREFFSLSFRVTPDVLIPRPETEMLVLTLLDRMKEGRFEPPIRIADVGTGSGIIAVCAAKHGPDCRVTAIDISPAALKVAAANATDHGVDAQIDWVESDLLEGLAADARFDTIVSNPPYIAEDERAELSADVYAHEPEIALFAGPKGTQVVERLVPQAAQRLVPGGWLLLEINPRSQAAVEQLIESTGCFQPAETVKDLAGLPRVVQARKRTE